MNFKSKTSENFYNIFKKYFFGVRKERFFYTHSNTQKTPCQYAKQYKMLKTRELFTGF